jgi:hypothetical protein
LSFAYSCVYVESAPRVARQQANKINAESFAFLSFLAIEPYQQGGIRHIKKGRYENETKGGGEYRQCSEKRYGNGAQTVGSITVQKRGGQQGDVKKDW